jgi:RimJ/RimL family protein N-acetyltransferase
MNTQSSSSDQSIVHIEPWGEGDLPLLKKLLGDPAMTEHLGGPESDDQLIKRQALFEQLAESGQGRMFKIIHETSGEAVGSVGYWDSTYQGEDIYEMGWSVLRTFQGQGIASIAVTQALVLARSDSKHQFLHAFPPVDNIASNAVCRKSGFTLVEEIEGEYPAGHFMQVNDWRLDLW